MPSRMHVCGVCGVCSFARARGCVRVQVKVRGNQCEVDNILTASPAFLCRRIEIGDRIRPSSSRSPLPVPLTCFIRRAFILSRFCQR